MFQHHLEWASQLALSSDERTRAFGVGQLDALRQSAWYAPRDEALLAAALEEVLQPAAGHIDAGGAKTLLVQAVEPGDTEMKTLRTVTRMAAKATAERSDDIQIVRVTPSQVRAAQILLELDREAGREPRRSTLAIAEAGTRAVRIAPSASDKTDASHARTASDRPRLA